MKRGIKGSLLLSSVDAFMAAAYYESYVDAGELLGVSSTTIMRQVRMLELWLHRVLIWSKDVFPTKEGMDFVLVAKKVLSLVDENGFRNELSKTRIHPDGVVTIEGEPIETRAASEIGKLLAGSRLDPGLAKPAPAKTLANDPLICEFLADWEKRKV